MINLMKKNRLFKILIRKLKKHKNIIIMKSLKNKDKLMNYKVK